jgi:hypothetical protein
VYFKGSRGYTFQVIAGSNAFVSYRSSAAATHHVVVHRPSNLVSSDSTVSAIGTSGSVAGPGPGAPGTTIPGGPGGPGTGGVGFTYD